MDKLIPTPEPKKFSFLDHFNNPGEAVGWVVLVAIVITIFFLFCYGGVRVMKKWYGTLGQGKKLVKVFPNYYFI